MSLETYHYINKNTYSNTGHNTYSWCGNRGSIHIFICIACSSRLVIMKIFDIRFLSSCYMIPLNKIISWNPEKCFLEFYLNLTIEKKFDMKKYFSFVLSKSIYLNYFLLKEIYTPCIMNKASIFLGFCSVRNNNTYPKKVRSNKHLNLKKNNCNEV